MCALFSNFSCLIFCKKRKFSRNQDLTESQLQGASSNFNSNNGLNYIQVCPDTNTFICTSYNKNTRNTSHKKNIELWSCWYPAGGGLPVSDHTPLGSYLQCSKPGCLALGSIVWLRLRTIIVCYGFQTIGILL